MNRLPKSPALQLAANTSTSTRVTILTGLGAVVELELSLIGERVRRGFRNARPKGKRIGRPRVAVDASRIAALRAQGRSRSTIRRETGIAKGMAQQAFYNLPQVPVSMNP